MATILDFWCIAFIIPVFLSIIFHVASDFRNWFIPFIALFTISTLFLVLILIFEIEWWNQWQTQIEINLGFDYFSRKTESAALFVYLFFGMLFMIFFLLNIMKKKNKVNPSMLILLAFWIISISIWIVSTNKSNELLVFSLFPTAVLSAQFMQTKQEDWIKDALALIVLCAGVFFYTLQLG